MKKFMIVFMSFYALSMTGAWWSWSEKKPKSPIKKSKSVFDFDQPASLDFAREYKLQERFEELMNEWNDVKPSEISKKDQPTEKEILLMLNSNNPEFLERTVWLYDQPFTVRQLLEELQSQASGYVPDLITMMMENYYLKRAQEVKDIALIKVRLALFHALRSIAQYSAKKASEMEQEFWEEIE